MIKYLLKYGINEEEINYLEDIFNENILDFLKENEEFIEEKLEFLKKDNLIIYPIIKNNLKIFLENFDVLEKKVEELKKKRYTDKSIQMVLMTPELYDKF